MPLLKMPWNLARRYYSWGYIRQIPKNNTIQEDYMENEFEIKKHQLSQTHIHDNARNTLTFPPPLLLCE